MICWGGERAARVFPTENVGSGFRPDGPPRDTGLQKPETQRTRKSKTPDGVTGTRATGDSPAHGFFIPSPKRRESVASGTIHYPWFVPIGLRVLRIFFDAGSQSKTPLPSRTRQG